MVLQIQGVSGVGGWVRACMRVMNNTQGNCRAGVAVGDSTPRLESTLLSSNALETSKANLFGSLYLLSLLIVVPI